MYTVLCVIFGKNQIWYLQDLLFWSILKKPLSNGPPMPVGRARASRLLGPILWGLSAVSVAAQVSPPGFSRPAIPVTAAIEGIVRNQARLVLADVRVTVRDTSGAKVYTAITTRQGVYRFDNLPPGSYVLTVNGAAFEPFQRAGIRLEMGEVFNLDITLKEIPVSSRPAAPASAAIEGVLRNPARRAVAGATIAVSDSSGAEVRKTITGRDGRYTLEDLPPGAYVLTADRAGFVPLPRRDIRLEAGEVFDLDITLQEMPTGPETTRRIDQPRLPRQVTPTTAAIEGTVRNQAGLGVGGVSVTVRDISGAQNFNTITGGDGIYRLLEVPPGSYELRTDSPGFESFERPNIRLDAGEVFDLDVILKETPGASESTRGIARLPELGPRPEPLPPEPVKASPYRTSIEPSTAELTGEPRPSKPLPSDEDVFSRVSNRWKIDYPTYRRYHQSGDYPYVAGHLYNPFNRNKIKGDYPIFGNQTFFNLTVTSDTFADGRRLPTPSNLGSERPDSTNFFGKFGQFFTSENLAFSFDLFRGDAAFRPIDWRVRFTPEVNVNYLLARERGIVNIDVRKGTTRTDAYLGLQEAFIEVKLRDLSHAYDFVSARAGIQGFNSDFRGFIFSDQEPGLRIFGNLQSNRYQYNLAYFAMLEKDTNSGLNRLDYRNQQVFIANLYRQDFLKLGYTIQVSFHYDKDDPSFKFDQNRFLVRPAPVGGVKPHSIRAYYYGLTGDGHIGKLNITHAFYQVLGNDSRNPIADRRVDINAQMAAVELSLDRDWLRYRISFFYASGDKDPGFGKARGGTARGFDAIFDKPNFAGGIFSFWNRESIRLTGSGVALVGADSLVPSLRSSKIQGQANFVNPGLYLYNGGVDIDVTPKLRGFINTNLVRFVRTEPLQLLLFQRGIHAGVGGDYGLGVKYRPPLTDNIVLTAGVNAFQPFRGFRDIYTGQTLFSAFANVRFQF